MHARTLLVRTITHDCIFCRVLSDRDAATSLIVAGGALAGASAAGEFNETCPVSSARTTAKQQRKNGANSLVELTRASVRFFCSDFEHLTCDL